MREFLSALALIAASALALPALAQERQEVNDEGDSPRRPVARERILRAFDRDADGRLNDDELAAVREQLGERFGELRESIRERREGRDGDDSSRDRVRRRDAERERVRDVRRGPDGPEGDRGPEGRRPPEERPRPEARRDAGPPPRDQERPREERVREERRIRLQLGRGPEGRPGPGGPRGPLGPVGGPPERNLQALFGWFDADGDNMLSRREFAELSQFVDRRRPERPDGPPGPARLGRRAPVGPPLRVDGEVRPLGRGERFGRLRDEIRDEIRRRVDDPQRRPDRDGPPRPRRTDGPPDPPLRESDRDRPDAI